LSTKKSNEADDKQSRIVWRPDEWLNFAVTYLHKYPSHSPQEANFRVRKEEFLDVQKSAISYERQRPVHNDVLIKASSRLAKIVEERGVDSLMSMAPFSAWTQDDYVAVANQLHVLRLDLNLLSSASPRGFTVQDLIHAQTALPPEKRVDIKDVSAYLAPLKEAYERIRRGNEGTTVTLAGPNHEHVVLKSEDVSALGESKLIRWTDQEIHTLAKEIHRRNPLKNYPHAVSFKSINAEEIICAQRETLTKDRRRNRDSIAQSMVKIRDRLAAAFNAMRMEQEKTVTGEELVGASGAAHSFADVSKGTPFEPTTSKPTRTAGELQALATEIRAEDVPQPAITSPISSAGTNAAVEAILDAARPLITVMLDQALQALAANLAPHLAQYLAPQVAEMLKKGALGSIVGVPAAQTAQLSEKSLAPSLSNSQVSPSSVEATSHKNSANEHAEEEHAPGEVNGNVASVVRDHDEDDLNDANGNVAFPSVASNHDSASYEPDFSHIDEIVLKSSNAHESRLLETRVLGTMIDRSGKAHLGIVGVKGKHVDELKSMFPDVHFFCVEKTSPEIMAELTKCDRVMGVEGYVNPIAHQLLGKMLKERYKTYSGGLAAVKAEIATWLRGWGSQNLRAA
jgi:hypothetical protein